MEKDNMHKFVSPDGKFMAVYMPRDNREDIKKMDELAEPILAEKHSFSFSTDLPKEVRESIDLTNVVVAIMEKDGNEWKKIDVVKLCDSVINNPTLHQEGYFPEKCPEVISVGKNHIITENYCADYGGYEYQSGNIKNEKGEWLSASLGDTRVSQHVIVNTNGYEGEVYFFDAETGKVEDTGYKRSMLWSHLDYAGLDKDGFTCDKVVGMKDDDPYSNKNFGKHAYIKRQTDGSYKEDFVSNDFIVKCKLAENAYFTTPSLRLQKNMSLYINGEKVDENIRDVFDDSYIKDNGAVMKLNKNNRPELFGTINGEYKEHLGNALISLKDGINYLSIIGKKDIVEIESTKDYICVGNVDPYTRDLVRLEKDESEPAIVISDKNNYRKINKVYSRQDINEMSVLGADKEDSYGIKYAREIDLMNRKGRDVR